MDSAVDFQGTSRVHIALTVSDLDASIAFYTALFQTEPTKHRPGYAIFIQSEIYAGLVGLELR
ncbi:MAG: VOC family protein, partial [Myxococcota bacterium]